MDRKWKSLMLTYITIAISLLSAYFFLPSSFQTLDDRLRDLFFKVRGPENVADNIVIVDIDEKSIRSLGQWPWERDKLALILKNLTAAQSGIIGLDIVFSEADKTSPSYFAQNYHIPIKNLPNYDEIFAMTVSDTPTILGYIFDMEHNNTQDAPDIPAIFIQKHQPNHLFLPQAHGVLPNIDIIQKHAYSSGFLNNIPDEGGMIRSVPLLIRYDMELYPSLVFEMYRIATNTEQVIVNYEDIGVADIILGKDIIPTDRFGRLYLNFRGHAHSYPYVSAVDVYENRIDKDFFHNKFVLIGTSAYGLMDLRSTPLENVIAGVEIHANLLDNLLSHDMLVKPAWIEVVDVVMILLSSFIVLFLLSRFSFFWFIGLFVLLFFAEIYAIYYFLFHLYIILNILFPLLALFLSLIAALGINYFFESKQKELIKQSFSKKVSQQVMEDLLKNPNQTDFTSKELEVTIYFSDLRDFTSISEKLHDPKKIVSFLNYYLNSMVMVIEKNKGTIDKFIGDAIMAYWNAPLALENHADKAVDTALHHITLRQEINKEIDATYGFELDFGIGINTGDVVVGELGAQGRSDYTIIGDAVNLASRLEGLCKVYKVRLIISEFTKNKLDKHYVWQLLDKVQVKGKEEAVKIYEIRHAGEWSADEKEELLYYNSVYQLYGDGALDEAYKGFEKLYIRYNKYLYKLYMQRIQSLQNVLRNQ